MVVNNAYTCKMLELCVDVVRLEFALELILESVFTENISSDLVIGLLWRRISETCMLCYQFALNGRWHSEFKPF